MMKNKTNMCENSVKQNYLFLQKESKNLDVFFKCCFEYLKREKVVLFLTANSASLLPAIKDSSLSKEEMKQLVIMQLDNIDAFTHKMLELHDWAWTPALIVVDLRVIIEKLDQELELISTVQMALHDDKNADVPKAVPFFQQIAFFIASLFGYRESILRRLKKRASSSRRSVAVDVNQRVHSVLILNEHSVHLNREQIELLINLYYWNNNAFDDIEELTEIIMLKN